MKKILVSIIAVLTVLTLAGAGCISFEIKDRGEAEIPNPSEETPAPNINIDVEVPSENVNAPIDDPTFEWEVYRSEPWAIEMRYPSKYKTINDTYGWPHALVHFIETDGAQSYRAQIETWDSESGFRDTYGRDPVFIAEHPNGKNWITVNYNDDPSRQAVADEWRLIISTFRFTAP